MGRLGKIYADILLNEIPKGTLRRMSRGNQEEERN